MPNFEVGVFTDPTQVKMFLDWLGEVTEPKMSRKARQTREAMEEILKIRQKHGYQPDLEQKLMRSYMYDPGTWVGRKLFRPSERQPEPLFMEEKPLISTTGRPSKVWEWRGATEEKPGPSLPPPHREPLLSREDRDEIWGLAEELYPDDKEAQRDFFTGFTTKRWATGEDKKYQAIGKVEEDIQTNIAQGMDEEAAKLATRKKFPKLFSIWEDFHEGKRLQREELQSRVTSREEATKINRAKQSLAEEKFAWQKQLEKTKETHRQSAANVRTATQALQLAEKIWKDEMALARAYREKQDAITMKMWNVGYTDSPTFNAYDYRPDMTFREWLNSTSGEPWLNFVLAFPGGRELLMGGRPTGGEGRRKEPPGPLEGEEGAGDAEQRLQEKHGFSPRRRRR